MTQLSPTSIKDALQSTTPIAAIKVQGWVRTRRDSKDFSFVELNDGSSLRNLQIIAKNTLPNYAEVQRLTTGASISVTGALVASQGKGQKWELFRVTTLDPAAAEPRTADGEIDYTKDFFARPTYLTVSGQLEAEALALALSKVYTFGPKFRAENSNTSRHASEFWMIEPEMAFCDLNGNMDLAEEFVKYLIADARKDCPDEMELFAKFVDKELLARLDFVVNRPFQRITYSDAVDLLRKSGEKFEFPIDYGLNLQSEHERWLTEKHFKCPVTVFNFPKEIKPFYMRLNDDGRTVAAMDLLVPGIGEIVGGSQREERLEMLEENMRRHKMDPADYKWYLDLRRYGTAPHSGFGLGFERMLMFITGVPNIRDVIPFARTPGSAEF